VEQLFESRAVHETDELFRRLGRNDDAVPSELPAPVRAYFEETQAMPSWADPAKIARAQELFERVGWLMAAGLFCASLPLSYAAADGALVLAQTRGMDEAHVTQRIFETAQFLLEVMGRDAFDPQRGGAIRAAQKVRLMHAGVRWLLRSRGDWDEARAGQPINQEDMAGALLAFSMTTLDALPLGGVTCTEEEAEAWLHAWKVVGHFLGVDPELLPEDVADGRALGEAIGRRRWRRSDEGIVLARALLGVIRRFVPPGTGGFLPAAVVRYFAGHHCAELLAVPPSPWGYSVARVVTRAVARALSHPRLSKPAFDAMRAVIAKERRGRPAQFRIPTALQQTIDPSA
jgi:hypothetical protein